MAKRGFMAIATAAALMVSASAALAQVSAPKPASTPQMANISSGPMTPAAMMNIVALVKGQVQPCADRQIIPARAASEIVAVVRLDLNPDGSLAGIRILDHLGLTETNARYLPQVDKAVEAIFTGCTPFHGLPPELYDVPHGWRTMKFLYRLKAQVR